MQVDREGIGEADGHATQRVLRPGVLAQHDAAGVVPIDRSRIQPVALAVEHAHAAAREILRILADQRQLVLAQDGRRHRPGRIEGQARHARLERWRAPRFAADLGAGAPARLAVLDIAERGAGDVHQQRTRVQLGRQPAQPLEVDAQLIEPARRADVERGERAATDHAVLLDPVMQLKGAHCCGQCGVVALGFARGRSRVAEQAPAQQGHARVTLVRMQAGPGGYRLPVRQRLAAPFGVDLAQLAVLRQLRARRGQRLAWVVQAAPGAGEGLVRVFACRAVRAAPERLECVLLEPAVRQVIQRLQVGMAGHDVGAEAVPWVAGGAVGQPADLLRGITGRREAVVGQ